MYIYYTDKGTQSTSHFRYQGRMPQAKDSEFESFIQLLNSTLLDAECDLEGLLPNERSLSANTLEDKQINRDEVGCEERDKIENSGAICDDNSSDPPHPPPPAPAATETVSMATSYHDCMEEAYISMATGCHDTSQGYLAQLESFLPGWEEQIFNGI